MPHLPEPPVPDPPDFFQRIRLSDDRVIEGRIAWGWECPQPGCVSETHYVTHVYLPQLELRCVACDIQHAVEL